MMMMGRGWMLMSMMIVIRIEADAFLFGHVILFVSDDRSI